jgi:hypothetical protein
MKPIGSAEMIAAIIALATVIWWLMQRSEKARVVITNAYLEQVRASTDAARDTAKAVSEMAQAVTKSTDLMQRHHEAMAEQHRDMCRILGEKKGD